MLCKEKSGNPALSEKFNLLNLLAFNPSLMS
jgi:hypothetical protein